MANPTPEFERPPLDEMVIGVHFQPLPNFRAAHFGLFWSRIRAEYPHTEDQTPVLAAVELNEIKPAPTSLAQVSLVGLPLPRCWFLSDDKTELVQVQQGGFWRNWRKVSGNECYPHFHSLARDFKQVWEKFLAFAADFELGPVVVKQCELSYINHIEKGAGWSELGELDKVFTILRAPEPHNLLPAPETLSWQARYKLPHGRGRLHVEMSPSFRGRDMKLMLALNLTVRGAPMGGALDQVDAWFDLAHEWALKAFTELTGPTAHELWGKTL
jgi:uncharacterized protein (TIGR04255 family)